jgi:hypothetical protein
MSPTTSTKARHAAEWTFGRAAEDAVFPPETGTGQHRANMIDAFRKHLARRFGSR